MTNLQKPEMNKAPAGSECEDKVTSKEKFKD